MSKKISGPGGPKKTREVTSVKQSSEVKGLSEISGLSQVGAIRTPGSSTSISGFGPKITEKNKDEVLKTIDTEAEKIFAGKRIPRKRQKTITDALKMAVLASALSEEEESS
jgi:hypothetical protein